MNALAISRVLRWIGGIVGVFALLAFVGAFWLLSTESGARWLLAKASPYLPEALSIQEVDGTLLSGLGFHDVDWQDATVTARVAELAVDFELMPLMKRELRISSLTVANADVSVGERPAGEADSAPLNVDVPIALRLEDVSIDSVRVTVGGKQYTIDTIRFGGSLSGSHLAIEHFDLQSDLADIGVSGEARLAGDLPIDASGGWELRLQDRPPLSGVLRIKGDRSGYDVTHDLDAPYAVTTEGTIVVADTGLDLDFENRWDRIRLAAADGPVIELSDGRLVAAGSLNDLEIDVQTALSSTDIPATAVRVSGNYTDNRFDVRSLSVDNDWGQLKADGVLELATGPSWNFNVALSDLDPAMADPRLRGSLEVAGETAGRFLDGKPQVDLTVASVSGELNGQPVEGSGLYSYDNATLKFEDAALGVGDNRIRFEGRYGARIGIAAKAELANLEQLDIGIDGQLTSDVRIDVDGDRFAASGFINGEELAWDGNTIDRLEANFELPVSGIGKVSLLADVADQGSLSTRLEGRLADSEWRGTINELSLRREPVGEWTLREAADFLATTSHFELQTACLGTASTSGLACIAVNYDASGPLGFEASIDGLPIAALPRYLPQGASILGEIGVEASGEFADGRLNATASMQLDGFGLITSYEGEDVSATFDTATIKADIVENRLSGDFEFRLEGSGDHASGTVRIADIFDQQSALVGQGSLELADLALLSFFAPDVANPLGRIYGSVEAVGSLAAPEISGEIGLRDGSADIRRAGISVAEVGLTLSQSKAGVLSLQGSAKSGDGYLRINGETFFGTESGIHSEIRLNGEDFRLVRLPDLRVNASPAITVVFDDRQTRISGELGIPEADITVKTVPAATKKPSQDVVVHRGDTATPQPGRLLVVDVTTALGERVSFSGFGLTTQLDGSVRISGTSQSPYQGFGRVVLREGRYQAYGQNLEIESGELVFNGPLNNPALNVRATRTASDKTVAGIHLTGTPAQLNSQVYSEPALADAEALSYLLTGRPLSNANSEEGDMLNQAAFALGLTTAGSVASRIRNELGLETLGFQGGAENRQLVAGKRLGDRLFIEYAYGVVDSLGTLLLRYQLSRRLMVESRSGSVRNVDVVYSVKKP